MAQYKDINKYEYYDNTIWEQQFNTQNVIFKLTVSDLTEFMEMLQNIANNQSTDVGFFLLFFIIVYGIIQFIQGFLTCYIHSELKNIMKIFLLIPYKSCGKLEEASKDFIALCNSFGTSNDKIDSIEDEIEDENNHKKNYSIRESEARAQNCMNQRSFLLDVSYKLGPIWRIIVSVSIFCGFFLVFFLLSKGHCSKLLNIFNHMNSSARINLIFTFIDNIYRYLI